MTSRAIVVTDRDFWPLQALVRARTGVSTRDEIHIGELAGELARSIPIDAAEVPADVVTMHARMRVRDLDSGAADTYTLVFPHQADLTRGWLSVLAPLGTALLGFRQGDEIVWEMPGGTRRLHIERVWPAALQTPAGAPHRRAGARVPHLVAATRRISGRDHEATPGGRGSTLPPFDGAA